MPDTTPIRVTALDPTTGDSGTEEILDDYCLITAGSAALSGVQVHRHSDGTATHVITVRGVRRG